MSLELPLQSTISGDHGPVLTFPAIAQMCGLRQLTLRAATVCFKTPMPLLLPALRALHALLRCVSGLPQLEALTLRGGLHGLGCSSSAEGRACRRW